MQTQDRHRREMKNKLYLFWVIILFIFLSDKAAALDFKELPPFVKGERVLIFTPHPDDETIGTGGLIQRALAAGSQLKVVCYTSGDHNELAFIVYEKRITFKKRELVHMGEVRQKETIEAMASLGLKENDIIFLGYPDFGTMEILTKYWGKTKPYRNFLNRVSRVPYRNAYSYDAPYVGESILSDVESIIYDFKPTKIFVSHPADTNRDHRALYLFLQVALWDLEGKIKPPQVFPCIIHVVGWPKPRGYHPDLELEPPEKLSGLWWKLPLSEEEIKAKRGAISFYKSQIEYNPPYLFTFARKNELFGDYPLVKLKAQNTPGISWQHLKIKEDTQGESEQDRISALAYALSDKHLLIRLTLKRKIDEKFGISIFLLGYDKEQDFSQMPKINLVVDVAGLRVKEKKRTFFIKDARLHFEDGALVIGIPLSTLGYPHYILSRARAGLRDLTLDDTAWHILYLE
jgi:LmbE family N-acetylglucosaminyl deacetylase